MSFVMTDHNINITAVCFCLEIPAGNTDLASIDLTLLVNKLLNSTETGML